jgi:hypothetical protein
MMRPNLATQNQTCHPPQERSVVFNGSIIDVAIGMMLLFFVASLVASAIVETIGGFLHRRQKHLWDTLDLLLGNTSVKDDPDLAPIVNELYQQPFITGLVRPTDRAKFDPVKVDPAADPAVGAANAKVPLRGRPTSKTRAPADLKRRYYGPSHIEPREFANALVSYMRNVHSAGSDVAGAPAPLPSGPVTREEFEAMLPGLPHDLQLKLSSIIGTVEEATGGIRAGIEAWFDNNMAAASNWYRKQTRWFLFLAGLVLACSLNVDSVHAAETLYRDDQARAAVVKIAEQVGEVTCAKSTASTATATTTPASGTTTTPVANIDLDCVRRKVGSSIGIPVGWSGADRTATGWILRALGWLLVGTAVTMGFPFWFDLLRRALNVRRNQGNSN